MTPRVALPWRLDKRWEVYERRSRESHEARSAESSHRRVLAWNLLMGSWLYMLIAGLSYAIRAHRHSRAQEAAAAEARLLAQQAQLAALRARVNPHFLFNALHSVGALVTTDPESADRALESLGGLLHHTLGTEEEVLLAQEWRFTEDYLAFERLRLGERLAVEARINPEALAVMVPPLVLQPLVEIAVRHGIAGGRVSLSATARRGPAGVARC